MWGQSALCRLDVGSSTAAAWVVLWQEVNTQVSGIRTSYPHPFSKSTEALRVDGMRRGLIREGR